MIEITTDYHKFWNAINENNQVIVYGAGYRTEYFSKLLLESNTPWNYIIDNNTAKENTTFCCKKVILPQNLKQHLNYESYHILVTVNDINGAVKTISENFDNAVVLVPPQERNLNNYNDMLAPIRRKLLKNDNFTILSNTCSATRMYYLTDTKFNSPTIASIIQPKDYFKLCKNPEHYIEKKIQFKEFGSTYMPSCLNKYPILKCDDILIHCVHTESVDKAIDDWNRRKERFNKNNLYMVFDTIHYKPCLSDLKDFLNIPFGNKLIFQYHIGQLLEHSIMIQDSQGIFNLPHPIEYWFDLIGWLNSDITY